jgi:exopolysaccharide transport family protein
MQQDQVQQMSQEEEIDIREYLRVIIKRKWMIFAVFAITVFTVTLHAFTAIPIYKTSTRLIIDKENPNVVSIQEVMAVDASGTDYYQTQYKIIESRAVARSVIQRLDLKNSPEFFPEPGEGMISQLITSIKDRLLAWKVSVLSLLEKDNDTSADEAADNDGQLISNFLDRMEVAPIRNSRLVDIAFEAKDPVLAARIANTIADTYIDQNLETRLNAVKDAIGWLNERIEEERLKVDEAERKLLQYKEKHNIITDFTSDVEKVTAEKLSQLNNQVVDAETRRVEAETRYRQALALSRKPDMLDSIPEVLNNELIKQVKSMEIDLYKKMSELSKKYGQRHPQIVAVQSELETLHKRKAHEVNRVIKSLKNEFLVASAKEKSLKEALDRQKKETLSLNQKAIQYSVLSREAESAKHMYSLLINRFKETSMTEDMKTGNIRIIDHAEVPKFAFKPKKKRNILLAMIVGLMMGTGLAFLLEYLDNTVNTPDDIQRYFNIPYLGPVPAIPYAKEDNESGKAWEMVTVHQPKSTPSESYRGIRTNILFSSAESQPGVVLFSSAIPQEGKSLTSLNVAITMAQAGSKVVLLDCDLRRPRLHKVFGLSRDAGMTNLLVGNMEADKVFQRTDVPNLYVIPSGPIPPNPSEILGSKRMKELVAILKKKFDRVIIDSAPISAVTDASILSRIADGIVLVIRAHRTPREVVKNTLMQLENVDARIFGCILNDVNLKKKNYYYYQYYYYYYGEDGDKKNSRKKKSRRKDKRISATDDQVTST